MNTTSQPEKKQNYVDFPRRQLSLGEHALSGANLASYDLCAVSNHHGTMNGGHHVSYCKPPQGDVWYQCNDKTVTRLRTPVKTSTAYLLFYDSVRADIWDISLVPTVHLMVWWWADVCLIYLRREILGGWGGVLMLVLWCRVDDVVSVGGAVGCGGDLDLSHYFPYPFWSHISQRTLLNTYAPMVLCWGRCLLLFHGLGIALL